MGSNSPISETLRQALKEAGPVHATAQRAGVHHAALLRFISGERTIRLDTADKLAEVLGFELKRRTPKRKG